MNLNSKSKGDHASTFLPKTTADMQDRIKYKYFNRCISDLDSMKLGLCDLQILSKEYLTPEDLDSLVKITEIYLPFITELEKPSGGGIVLMTRTHQQSTSLTEMYEEYYSNFYTEKKGYLRLKIDKYQGELYKYPQDAINYYCSGVGGNQVTVRCGGKAFITHLDNIQESVLHIKTEWSELLKNNEIELEFN